MTVVTAFLLIFLALKAIHADEDCRNAVSCPCGNKGVNVTVCADDDIEVCTQLSKCKECQEGSNICSECPEGLEGPSCSQAISKTCENPGPISNGEKILSKIPVIYPIPAGMEASDMKTFPVGSEFEYVCDDGYRLEGSKSLTCNPMGLWSAEVPTCIKTTSINCETPKPLLNGEFQFSHPTIKIGQEMKQFPLGTVRESFCNEGYLLQGYKQSNCETCSKSSWNCIGAWWTQDNHPVTRPNCKIECGRDFCNSVPNEWQDCGRHVPWVVSISVEDENGLKGLCLGVLLNYNTVLTAAHCLIYHRTFIIQFGKNQYENQDDDVKVMARKSSRTILHPNFSNTTFDSNIGLLIFEPKIGFTADVQPICLWDYYDKKIVDGKTTGIVGVKDSESNFPTISLFRMTVLSVESCLEVNKEAELIITKNSFCAGNKVEKRLCTEEGGAPFYTYDRSEGKFYLLGILSFPTRGSCGYYSHSGNQAVFTRIGNFVQWISKNMK